mgnify:CR=1 FL=1
MEMTNLNENNYYSSNNYNLLGKKVKSFKFMDDKNNSKSKYQNDAKKDNNKKADNYNHNNNNNNNYRSNSKANYNNNSHIESHNENDSKLPIFSKREEILEKIEKNRVIIISGNTGCGKSTQVPQFIYEYSKDSKILMTQPRRIAAISIAKRLSDERHTKLGSLIGYHVSLLQYMTSETKIFVKTTGIFLEELLHNNGLNYNYIILDEVHERDLYIDLVLALLKNYFEQFPNSKIKLILMSATIAEEDFANYLEDININFNRKVPIIRINEKWHEVQKFYVDEIILKILSSNKVSQKLKTLINNEKSNCVSLDYFQPTYSDSLFPIVAGIIEKTENVYTSKRGILIFVPGLGEIQDLHEYLINYFGDNNDLEFFILHSQVNDDEQERVFKINEKKRKIILATNIAESSITISNIDFVIDFCLVKQMKFDENQNTSILELKWCSKASCQQRKGRTGRVARGYYFQLITKELFEKLKDHQEPEILRTPLETPILKLKLFNPNEEPEEILFKTMNPPSQDVIINTIFRLQKMGALVNIKFEDNKEDIKEEFGQFGNMKKEKKENKMKYNSGKVTKIGRIFADLPIDIKYSRLILLSYSLGQIDVGISLAAILSQDRALFLNSTKCNRISLYDSKNYYCGKQNCDFIALYTAYKVWCSKYRNDFINDSVSFDTRLKRVNGMRYKEILSYTKENNMDLRTIKEILKVENDLKKRLALKGYYSKYFKENPLNFLDKKSAFIFKIILAGTFYNQIFAPEYNDFQSIESNQTKNEIPEELYTIRLSNISSSKKDKLIEIFKAIVGQEKIEKVSYENCAEMVSIKFSDIESISKILFITSSCLRHNNEIPLFKYVDKKTDSNSINSSSNYNEDKTVIIRLDKEPDYIYNLHYFDVFVGGQIYMDKDSINLTHIIPNYEELKKTSFVTDSYINKSGNSLKKSARYSSLLPRSKMFDKIMMLIFGPKFEMIASKIENSNKFSQYIGFQYDEYIGNNCFDYEVNNRNISQKQIFKNNFIKLDYLITNYHLLIINQIRKMINETIEPKFGIENGGNENDKIEFEEKMKLYLKNADDILKKIKQLVDEPKIKYISDKKYIELYNYIDRFKRKFKKHNYNPDDNEESKEDESERLKDDNKVEQKNEGIYSGYINEIKKLNIKEEDFLQLHEPLLIMEEYYHSQQKRKELLNKENKLLKLYDDYNDVLNTIKSLAFNNEAWLCCSVCFSEICAIKKGSPKMTEKKNIGEHLIEGAWIISSLRTVKENEDKIKEEQIKKFKEELNKNNIIYNDLFCCPKGETVIGYINKDERYIYYGSKLFVKYPDLNIECVFEEDYKNDFIQIHQKVEKILMAKEKKDFKKMICCKLCDFTVEKNIRQFNQHLLKKCHRERMEELKKEFLY